jgi:lipid II:glycine glycyltransferase (peptidoglycan interpeptide bridge formation enzyme)
MKALAPGYRSEVDLIGRAEWAELLQTFDDATIYQTWSYGSVRWGEDNLSHLLLKRENKVAGLAQVTIKRLPFFRAGIAYIARGPIWRVHGEKVNVENFRQIVKALKDEYVSKRNLLLRIAPEEIEDDNYEIVSILEAQGFRKKSSIVPERTLLVDLTSSIEQLRKTLDQKWRNQLNRAEKNGLKTIEGGSDELYKIFLDLQEQTIARKHYVPGVDYDEFREIQKDLPDSLKMKIIVCEYQ